jgi:pyridoxamine 5'-phosphate oxidase
METTPLETGGDALYQEALDAFDALLSAARASGDPEPTAMTLATADASGRVSARMVLLKGFDASGFRFFSNYESAKAAQLEANPQAALCFHWKRAAPHTQVQVRVEGRVGKLPAQASDAYFASRSRGSQVGAWASEQSRPLPDRDELERAIAAVERRFGAGPIPRPPHWGGYLLAPDRIEFWYGAEHRLHERQLYRREGGAWTRGMLYP